MIVTALLTAAFAAATVGILAAFWEDIKNWLRTLVKTVMKAVQAAIMGVKVFIKKAREGFEEIAKSYQLDNKGQWHQTTVTKQVPPDQVPPEIRAKAKQINQEVDISDELEQELKLVV
ncbi:hypothetical protein MO973_25230 [Paenibacillus sp. TRM 82003]|nr:hypothetical protein [Paenibacillus sp. TRM 82003]